MKPNITFALACLGLVSCGGSADKAGDGSASPPDGCNASLDSDSDGLDDCTEEDLGLDPNNEDSDGDGLTDAAEVDCGTSALDPADTCYACGWGKNDPGDITATGAALGDVMENISLVDQCGEMVDIYDFAGEYHILYMTAAF